MKLSLCLIVKDEENNIRNLLEIISPLIDEIIVVDTGSSDNTIDIAKEFNVKIFFKKFKNNFSDVRNFSISKATGDYILVLDADEIIYPEDFLTLRKYIDKDKYDGFLLSWVTHFEKGVTFGIKLSLFRNKKNIYFEGMVHESVINSIRKFSGTLKKIDVTIHHYPNLEPNFLNRKEDFYFKLMYKQLRADKKFHCLTNMFIGYHFHKRGKIEKSLKYFREAIKYPNNIYYPVAFIESCIMVARLSYKNNKEESLRVLKMALSIYYKYKDDVEVNAYSYLITVIKGLLIGIKHDYLK